jgi:nuclear pore complex protein Nup188
LYSIISKILIDFDNDPKKDPIRNLASCALDELQALDTLSDLASQFGPNAYFSPIIGTKMRLVILDFLQYSTSIGYSEELVTASLSAITGGQDYWDILDAKQPSGTREPDFVFVNNESLNWLLEEAQRRYPYEALPFLQFTRALASSTACYGQDGAQTILHFIERMPSFTHILPENFSRYETTRESEDENYIRLLQSIPLFDGQDKLVRQIKSSALSTVDHDFYIPQNTIGRMISTSQTLRVAQWNHQYSGFKYLGKLLETFLAAAEEVDATTGKCADREAVTEIITFFAIALQGFSKCTSIDSPRGEALRILQIASSGLRRNRDITTVVFDIFEEELQRQSVNVGFEGPLDLLTSCVQFLHALISITPGRVWPFIGRSGLLELSHDSSKLSTIVSSIELVSGRYEFLLSCTRLYEELVQDIVVNRVSRRCRAKSSARFGGEGTMAGTGMPDQVLSKVLLSFTRFFVDAFESSCTWKFLKQNDCRRLRKNIAGTFNRILHWAYGLEEPVSVVSDSVSTQSAENSFTSTLSDSFSQKRSKLLATFESAALYIADSFLSISSGSLRVQPILQTFYDGLEAPDTTFYLHESALCVEQVQSVLTFSRTLLQVSALLGRPSSQLELQLFKASPLLARLYAVNDAYRIFVVALLEALVVSVSINTTEPPSLLGYLGSRTSRNFLHILSSLDKPLSRQGNFIAIMHFLSRVMSGRQQWFANYLLTGRTARDALNSKDTFALDRPTLNTALDTFSRLDGMPKIEAMKRLEFIALAQNYWPWATYDSKKHADFIKHISEYIGTLRPLQPASSVDDIVDAAYQTRMASLIAEILAMSLFHSRQTGGPSKVTDLIPNIDYFTRFAVAIPAYNTSLHANLKRNFEAQYPGYHLLDFQKSSLEVRQFGENYFYDLNLMNKMLSFDQAWVRRTGFRTEVVNANINLSLMDAQIVGSSTASISYTTDIALVSSQWMEIFGFGA